MSFHRRAHYAHLQAERIRKQLQISNCKFQSEQQKQDAAPSAGVVKFAICNLQFAILFAAVATWAAIFVAPMIAMYVGTGSSATRPPSGAIEINWLRAGGQSAILSAVIAFCAVALGYLPGKLLGTMDGSMPSGQRRMAATVMLTLAPLLLPTYVIYYAWSMLLGPTTMLGQYTSSRPELAQLAATLTTLLAMMLWHWPIAALILAQGWRSMDAHARDLARLDAGAFRGFIHVHLPLLARPILLAFGASFVLSLSEFTTFSLAGVRSIGTELYTLFEYTRDEGLVARAAWPMIIPAALMAIAIWKGSPGLLRRRPGERGLFGTARLRDAGGPLYAPLDSCAGAGSKRLWAAMAVLLALSCAAPAGLFIVFLSDPGKFAQFGLHAAELGWSALIAVTAAAMSLLLAAAARGVKNCRFQINSVRNIRLTES